MRTTFFEGNGKRVEYCIGVDLGQAADYTVVMVVECEIGEAVEYRLRYLRRYELGTPYPEIVKDVVKMKEKGILTGCDIVVDGSGVGRPVVDMLKEAGLVVTAVTITGGQNISREQGYLKVPKRDIVGGLLKVFQSGRIKFAAKLPLVKELMAEISSFNSKITTRGNDTYEAMGGGHDDMVMALAITVWWKEHCYGGGKRKSATDVMARRGRAGISAGAL